MRLLFLGDIVGASGCEAVISKLPLLIERYTLDFVIANAENSANGFGLEEQICMRLHAAGVDVLTGGNHSWSRREALTFIERQPNLLRPLNFTSRVPGRGVGLFATRKGRRVLVINIMGRVFMHGVEDPFSSVKRELNQCRLGMDADAIVIDFHAEATSEKQGMAHFVDGEVSLVAGTHTHVPTADHRILPRGTAMITDVGMCGDYESIIGMDSKEPLRRFLTGVSSGSFVPACSEGTISGVAIETNDQTGLARFISPLRSGGVLKPESPSFWE